MFYPKSKEKFDIENFKNPDKSYRAAPFWAWNTRLDKVELMRQIEVLKEMGFGGFHIHSRTGMATPYLSEQYFDLVTACVNKGKEQDMLTYLYDEDRWPSGSGGGFVTKTEEFRQTYLIFVSHPSKNDRNELLAAYDIVFDENRDVLSYKIIDESDIAEGEKWYAYSEVIETGNAWFNYQCYVDMLNPDAIAEFIRVTHESYKKHLGDEFQKSVVSIFTDEPQTTRKNIYDHKNDDFMIPWTKKFEENYTEKYGENIIDSLPEIFFEIKNLKLSTTRYNYHELTTEMFATAFSDQCGKWCDENGLPLTGHVMSEGDLVGQTLAVGDAMRHYRHFTLPGIDMLMNGHEFTTAKQVQSMQRQKGAEGVLCELDGVTNWDFDFRSHKLHGDWQAALGVTLRVPHLSWVSMNGEAKRDYPASINYQAAWYKKYHIIEDYFARINSVMSRGKAICKIAVLHPVRDMWCTLGTYDKTSEKVAELNSNFTKTCAELVKNHIDFDYISESNLKFQKAHCKNGELVVQNSRYNAVIIPQMLTLKDTTVEILDNACKNGVEVIAFGTPPEYIDAKPSDKPKDFFNRIAVFENSIDNIKAAIEKFRDVEITENSELSNEYCCQLKDDGENKWLFISKAVDPSPLDDEPHQLKIYIRGKHKVCEYNCLSGNVYKLKHESFCGKTLVKITVHAHDSILLKLSDKDDENAIEKPQIGGDFASEINSAVDYKLLEENVFLIDNGEMKLDDGDFESNCDILRRENEFRARLGIKARGEGFAQPWVDLETPKPEHIITFKKTFESKIDYKNAVLALETPEECEITFNGKKVSSSPIGWYVDKCIKKIKLGTIKKGVNELVIKMPFGLTTNAEYMYILGSFGVYDTKNPYIDVLPKTLEFGDISKQGLLFYGGNIDYYLDTCGAEFIKLPEYKGGLVEILSDNESLGEIIYSPYELNIGGKSNIIARFYGTRINTFGQLHLVQHDKFGWYGPYSWRTDGKDWTDDYLPWEQGILKPPMVK